MNGFMQIGIGVLICILLTFIVDLIKRNFTPFLWYLVSLLIAFALIFTGYILK